MPTLTDLISERLGATAPALPSVAAPSVSPLTAAIQSRLAPPAVSSPDLQPPAVPGEVDQGYSLFGFLGNIVGDIQEFAVGLGHLGAAILGDITKIPGDLAGGEVAGGYATAKIVRALPSVLKSDYATRYGSPEAIAQGLYKDPLAYFLDLLMIGDVAALGARVAGRAAVKSSQAATQTAEIMTGMYGRHAGARAGLEVLAAERGGLSPGLDLARRILPEQQNVVVDVGGKTGPRVQPLSQARNPVTRATTQTLFRRITSNPLDRLVAEADQLRPYVTEGTSLPWMDVRLSQIDRVLEQAATAGATRIQNKFVAQWDLRRVVDRMASQAHAELLRQNAEDATRVEDLHKGLSPVEVELGAGEYQRMSVGMSSHGWDDIDVSLGPEEAIGAVVQPTTDLPTLTSLLPDANVEVHEALHTAVGGERIYGPYVKPTQSPAAVQRKMATNNALLDRAGGGNPALRDAGGIEDLLGYRVILDDWKQATEIVEQIRSVLPIQAIYNNLGGGPNGFRGARVYVQSPRNGLVAEIQLHTPGSMKMADVTGPVHKYIRDLEEHIALVEAPMSTTRRTPLPSAPAAAVATPPTAGGAAVSRESLIGTRVRFLDINHRGEYEAQTGTIQGFSDEGSIAILNDKYVSTHGHPSWKWPDDDGNDIRLEDGSPLPPIAAPEAVPAAVPTPKAPPAPETVGGVAVMPPAMKISPATLRDLEMARAYERGLHGAVAREIEANITGRELTGIEQAMEGMRLFIQERFANPMLEKGLATPADLLERSFRPLKFMSGAEWNPRAGAFEGGTDTLELVRMLDDAGITQPLYFPHLDARRLSRRSFLMSKSPHAARAIAAPGHEKLDTMFLFQHDLYLKDPVQAYIRRAAHANRAEETFRFVQWVLDEFGRPIGKTDELIPGAEMLYDPDGLWRFYRQRVSIHDDVLRNARHVEDFDEALAEALEGAVAVGSEEALAKLAHSYVGVSRNPIYAVPTTVAKRLEAHSAQMLGEAENWVRLFWDSPIALWRWTVLAASPRWVMNNTLGNIYFLKMQGARLRDVAQILMDRYFKRPLNEMFHTHFNTEFTDLVDALAGIDSVGSGFFSAPAMKHVGLGAAQEETAVGRFYGRLGETRAVKLGSRWGEFVRRVNAGIERSFREASYIRALDRQQIAANVKRVANEFWTSKERIRRIAENGALDPEGALQEVNKFFGDYLTLGPYERKIVRRFLMPFYGFYKHVTKLTARLPFDSPVRAATLLYLGQAATDVASEVGPVPEWLEKGWPLGPGAEAGAVTFASTSGMNPFALFTQTPLSTLNPAWKILYEQSMGRSSFTGKQFTAPDVVVPFGSNQQYRILTDSEGNPIDAVPVEKVAPGLLEHFLQQVPMYQIAKDAIAQGATYSTSTIFDVIEGDGVLRDPGGAPMFPESPFEGLAQYAGVPMASQFDVNVDEFQARQLEERESALVTYARRMGLIPPAS